jgi:Tol biopolymer transport system component
MRIARVLLSRNALSALALVTLAGCATDRMPDAPTDGSDVPADLAGRSVALRVDVAEGRVTVLSRPPIAAAPGGDGRPSLALLGANEIGIATSNFFRSAQGQFTPKKVTVRFDVSLTDKAASALLEPTFPAAPAGVHALLLFPFSATVTGGTGSVDPSVDWDGGLTNFFKDGNCTGKTNSDCYRYEPFPAPLATGATTPPRTVGFDIAPSVTSFVVYLVLSADLQIPSITGTVISPERGPMGGITVTASPSARFATTDSATGAYSFTSLAPGSYTVAVSGLPAYCFPVAPQTATVVAGTAAAVNFKVFCPRIAFSSERAGPTEIFLMNADGSNQTRLTTSTCCGIAYVNFEAAWSPDGKQIAVDGSDLSANGPDGDIFLVNADGSGSPVNLTNHNLGDSHPSWSPDGKRIAFVSRRDGNSEIYIMNADGSQQTRITNTTVDEFDPVWSPLGNKIVYGESDGSFNTELFSMNVDGSGRTPLASNPAEDGDPAWSPDGTRIVFSSRRGGILPDIYTMNADGSGVTRLTTTPNGAQQPSWSPDGSRITFTQVDPNLHTGPDIWVMNADGSGQTQLTTDPGFDNFPAWQP